MRDDDALRFINMVMWLTDLLDDNRPMFTWEEKASIVFSSGVIARCDAVAGTLR